MGTGTQTGGSVVVTVIMNDADVPPGHLGRVLDDHAVSMDLVRAYAGEPFPALESTEAIVVLGGEMGAYDTHAYPYLASEKRFLADAAERGIPILGICLGCQLLADALGGSVHLADAPEYHLGPVEVLGDDATVTALGTGATFALHRDTWHLPPGAELVARTAGFNHAFRLGSALGVQSHPELTLDILRSWLETPKGDDLATAAGSDALAIIEDFERVGNETAEVAGRFFGAWLHEIGA